MLNAFLHAVTLIVMTKILGTMDRERSGGDGQHGDGKRRELHYQRDKVMVVLFGWMDGWMDG